MEGKTDFSRILAESNPIVVLMRDNPSLDQIAAGLALYLSLKVLGRNVGITSPSPMLVGANRLVGIDKVSQELSGKNLRISFKDYQADGIERVSYDVENGKFFLTVIPKSGVTSPTPEQVDINYTGIGGVDTVVLVGVKTLNELGSLNKPELLSAKNIVVIGLERGGVDIARVRPIEVVDSGAAGFCEIVGNLILSNNLPFDADIAANLYQGLVRSTNNFTAPKVRAETFQLAAELVRAGAKTAVISTPTKGPITQEQQVFSEGTEDAPQDWFGPPRVFTGSKGTSI